MRASFSRIFNYLQRADDALPVDCRFRRVSRTVRTHNIRYSLNTAIRDRWEIIRTRVEYRLISQLEPRGPDDVDPILVSPPILVFTSSTAST